MQPLLIIGYGNLAHAIARGLASSVYKVFVLGRNFEKSKQFAQALPFVTPIEDINALKDQSPILLLCVKPKGLSTFSCSFHTPLIYSVMAGINIHSLTQQFPNSLAYVRAMPNVGALVGKSATTLYAHVLQDQKIDQIKAMALELTLSFGEAVWVEQEDLIDASIAPSGSSPAFLSLVAQALIDAGVREGLSPAQSQALVGATFRGFSELLKSHSPQEIKTLVTSPAGTTAEGLAYLEERGFKGTLEQGAHQSVLKAKGKL